MENFTPQKLGKTSFFATPVFFLGLPLLLLIGGGIYFFTYQEFREPPSQPPPPVAMSQRSVPAKGMARTAMNTQPAEQNQERVNNSENFNGNNPINNPVTNRDNPLPEPSQAQDEKTRPAESSNVKVEFILATKDIMNRLAQEGEGRIDSGRYSYSVVPNFKSKYDGVHSEPGFKTQSGESRPLTLGQPALVFSGGKDTKTNETIGFYVEVTPSRQTERGTEYKVAVKRSLPEATSTTEWKVNTQNFDETVNVPRGGAVVYAGLLPRRAGISEDEARAFESNVFKTWLDSSFQNGDEEFLLVVQPHFGETPN